jgi:hypothetical protein
MDAKFRVTCDHKVGIPAQNFTLNTCPRCLGKGFYNAFSFGTDGKIVTVSGINKLSQQIQKILTEPKRPTGYGFDYSVLSGVIAPNTLTAVKSEVIRCIEYLKSLQTQEKSEGFIYLPTEEIDSISVIDAFVDPTDPRAIFINVSVVTKAGNTSDVSTRIKR